MKWVTWQNVGVDRIGCAWLIRKHAPELRVRVVNVVDLMTLFPPDWKFTAIRFRAVWKCTPHSSPNSSNTCNAIEIGVNAGIVDDAVSPGRNGRLVISRPERDLALFRVADLG